MERNENYTIAEGYRLPSGGLIYDVAVNPEVELRSMSARDEMKRLNPSATPFKTLADIIEGCMLTKPTIHVYDMALGDYEYLLHKLRIVTYGSKYKLDLVCPECGEIVETEADLETLELKEFDIDKFNSYRTFMLPKSGKEVMLKFQTPHMLDMIDAKAKELKRKFKLAEINFEVFSVLTNVIDTVDGKKLSQVELETFINNLPALDMNKIMQNLDALNTSIGLNNELYVTCGKCGSEVKTFFRFGTEFFRPTNI